MVSPLPASGTGAGLTVTVTSRIFSQAPLLAVRKYTVDTEGLAWGVNIVVLFKPLVGDQAKLCAFEAAARETEVPSQIGAGVTMEAVMSLFKVIVAVCFAEHLSASVTIARWSPLVNPVKWL